MDSPVFSTCCLSFDRAVVTSPFILLHFFFICGTVLRVDGFSALMLAVSCSHAWFFSAAVTLQPSFGVNICSFCSYQSIIRRLSRSKKFRLFFFDSSIFFFFYFFFVFDILTTRLNTRICHREFTAQRKSKICALSASQNRDVSKSKHFA